MSWSAAEMNVNLQILLVEAGLLELVPALTPGLKMGQVRLPNVKAADKKRRL